jgi:hypothetical protein
VANHRFNIGAIEAERRNKAEAEKTICNTCVFQFDDDHDDACRAGIKEAGNKVDAGFYYVVYACSKHQDRRPVMVLV